MKNKTFVQMTGLFMLMMSTTSGVAFAGLDIFDGNGMAQWSKVDENIEEGRLMEAAYDDTLRLGDVEAKDKALRERAKMWGAVNNLMDAQRAWNEEVEKKDKNRRNKLSLLEELTLGTLSPDELKKLKAYCDAVKENGGKPISNSPEIIEKLKQAGLTDEEIKEYDQTDQGRYWANGKPQLADMTEEDWETAIMMASHRTDEDRRKVREETFSGLGDSVTTDPTGKLKKDLEEAPQNLAQTLTPEMQANLRSELGIEDGTDLDAALKDPTSRQALEDKLKKTPQWSNIDLDTPAGENLFRALTGATGGLGDEITVE